MKVQVSIAWLWINRLVRRCK
uniref:Uncharacterized protein n=1 Tax=Arundo donax TaxID=35708 RepID=A0A0A9EBQ6_ARUDO